MRILRGAGARLTIALTAGNFIGAAPHFLSPGQRALVGAQGRRRFTEMVDFTVANQARLLVAAGGLFASADPDLDDLRFITQQIRHLHNHECAVVVLDDLRDRRGHRQSSGLDLLADMELVRVLRSGPGDAFALEANGLRLGFTADPGFVRPAGEGDDLAALLLVTRDAAAADRDAAPALDADLVVLGDSREAGDMVQGQTLFVRPGWTAVAANAAGPATFAWAEVGADGVRELRFIPLADTAAERVRVGPEQLSGRDPAVDLRAMVDPLLGATPFLSLEFEGRFTRDRWHACRAGDLVRAAEQQGTVVSVDVVGLDLDGRSTKEPRASFGVEVRRAADRLARDAEPSDADLIRDARSAVADAFRRRTGLEPIS